MALFVKQKWDHKFRFGQLVVYKEVYYYVCGIRASFGYNFLKWEYDLARPHKNYGVDPTTESHLFDGYEYNIESGVKEIEIQEYEVGKKLEFAKLEEKKAKLQAEIDKINAIQKSV